MPLKIYCPNVNCAEPILYELTKPVVCPFCATNLSSNTSFAGQKPKKIEKQIKRQIKRHYEIKDNEGKDNDDFDNLDDGESLSESFSETFPNIDKLDVKIESFGSEDSIKLGEVMLQKKTGLNRPKTKRVNKKAEFEKFRAQAGAGGRQVIEITDRDRD